MFQILSILLPILLGALVGWLIGRDALPLPAPRRLAMVVLPVMLLAGWLTAHDAAKIQAGLARTHWPTVTGMVVSAEVVAHGRKNYRPDIRYRYELGGRIYRGESNYGVPGFGMSSSRREIAEAYVADHGLGTEVTVFVNPLNPADAWLRPGPRWDSFGQYGLGLVLLGLGALLLSSRLIGRQGAGVGAGQGDAPTRDSESGAAV